MDPFLFAVAIFTQAIMFCSLAVKDSAFLTYWISTWRSNHFVVATSFEHQGMKYGFFVGCAEQFTISCYTIKWMEIKVQGARYVLYCQTSYTMPVIFNSKKSWRGEGWLFLETKWTFLIYWIWRAETEHKEI